MANRGYEFPFVGAGDANYFELAELVVRFVRQPTAEEKEGIEAQVPAPLTESVDWHEATLYVCSPEAIHFAIVHAYAIDTDDADAEGHAGPVCASLLRTYIPPVT